MVIKKW